MLALVTLDGQRLFHKKLPCELNQIQQALSPYKKRIHTIAVESTFNWYWLVDGLQFDGYHTVLANPAAIQQYDGVKHTDDKHDAFWLGEMLRLKILPTAHIYERTLRPVRDLLRRRLGLVRKRTALILSLESLHHRMHGQPLALATIKRMEVDEIWRLFHNSSDQLMAREDLRLIREFDLSIERLEQQVLKAAVKMPAYERLLSIPGIGKILGMTIVLETGDIKRFATPGDFASYGRCVRSTRLSNEKKKGENNAKCGNRYLAWAFVEAANFAARYDGQAQRFYQRKKAQRNNILATKALACKLAKAAWHIMSKDVDYEPGRLLGGTPPEQRSSPPKVPEPLKGLAKPLD
jgi:transposase